MTLTELAQQADVTPRTVRYYMGQGLIPGPAGQGRGAHYGEGHVRRVSLIKRLQREHLPLAEIRARVAALDDAAVESALEDDPADDREVEAVRAVAEATDPDPERALAYIRRVLDEGASRRAGPLRHTMNPSLLRQAKSRSLADASPPPAAVPEPAAGRAPERPSQRYEPHSPEEYPLRTDPGRPSHGRIPLPPSLPSRVTPGERSTWERIPLDADVEVHVRRPLDRETNRRLDRLLTFARELFEDR